METVSTTVVPVIVPLNTGKTPVFIEYTEDFKKDNGLSNHIDCFPSKNLLRSPDEDCFENNSDNELKSLGNPQMKSVKMPSGSEIIAAVVLVKELFGVLDDAAKAGKNLWETLSTWIGDNKDLSDKEKVQALQIGNVLAKQMSVKEAA